MKTIFNYLSFAILIGAFIFLLVFGYWAFYPYKVLEFKDPKFPIVSKTVKSGESINFVTNYCKLLDFSSTTTRAFVDSVIYYTLPITSNIKLGCNSTVVNVPVPLALSPGKYYIQNVYEYKVNPIRTIVTTHFTEEFEVIK